MVKHSLSRRDFLKSMGVGIAALNLPLSITIVEAAEIRAKKNFMRMIILSKKSI